MKRNYDDILNLPHHTSKKHPRMANEARAAQFSPFAALTGHEDAVKEVARITDEKITFDENAVEKLNMKLQIVESRVKERPLISVTYYCADANKPGGAYVTVTGQVKKIDEYDRKVIFFDGDMIKIEDIIEITGEIFEDLL